MFRKNALVSVLLCAVMAGSLAACSEQDQSAAQASETAPESALVTVIAAKPETVILADELPGRVAAFRTAEIRPQVGGIIEKRLYEQGSEVQAGQQLFLIGAATFKAELDSAAAALQRMEAGLVRARAVRVHRTGEQQ